MNDVYEIPDELPDRFLRKVVGQDGGCWLWIAVLNREGGYGQFGWCGRLVYAHRFAYEVLVGRIPRGMVIDHLCRVPNCVNPEHMEAVTQRENVRRGRGGSLQVLTTHCPSGHEYTAENTYVRERSPGGLARHCRECNRVRSSIRYRESRPVVS